MFNFPPKPIDEKEADRRYHLALILVLGTIFMESALAFFGFSPRMSGELVGRVMGTLDSMSVMAVSYYFQSRWTSFKKETKDDSV